MNDKSFDICIPIAVVLVVVAAWQFYGLVSDGPQSRHGNVELAASPPPSPQRADPPGD